MPDIRLPGLRPEPIAKYLSALGVLRLVAEQAHTEARGRWVNGYFVLSSDLEPESLLNFLLNDYEPTPIVAPWNNGSGFHASGTKEKAVKQISSSTSPRLSAYRAAIAISAQVLAEMGGPVAIESKTNKAQFIARLRSELPDEATNWMDAALVLSDGGSRFSPLLCSGGNDGNFEFSLTFMKRIVELFLNDKPATTDAVRGCIMGIPAIGGANEPVGQFSPARAGGANISTGFKGNGLRVNPWSYVLMIEGVLMLASAATRRLDASSGSSLSFPFATRSATVGYPSAAAEGHNDEQWLPLWHRPASYPEVRHLFAEGRAKVGSAGQRRDAVDSVDFVRAISTLGIDRGVDEFIRYGFQQRFGRMFFAVPLGRWAVRSSKGADLLAEIDPWLTRLRGFVGSGKAPASVASATRRLEAAIMEACQRDEWATTLEILITLGEVESTLGRANAKDRRLGPLPSLSNSWFYATRVDPSPEYRLAASLASAGIRARLRPVELDKHRRWEWASPGSKTMTWADSASLVENLLALLRRREIEDQQGKERVPHRDADNLGFGRPRCWASLADVTAFIDGDGPRVSGIDERRLEALIGGLSLIDWARVGARDPKPEYAAPPAGYSLLALAHGLEDPTHEGHLLPATTGMLANAAAGRLEVASRLAIQRLRASGLPFTLDRLGDTTARARRIAAALAFPLAPESLSRLQRMLFPRISQTPDHEPEDVHQ